MKVLRGDSEVYEPREDTMLLLEEIGKLELSGKRVLEVGAGSGVLALFCAEEGAAVLATDISVAALRNLRYACNTLGLNVGLVRADMLSGVRSRFDYLIFNPPYLPSGNKIDAAVDGGIGGKEIIERFLEQLGSSDVFAGPCLLLMSSLNEPSLLVDKWRQFEFRRLTSKRLFFEELMVFRVSRR
jgi:release factor glutamine methyltransferase